MNHAICCCVLLDYYKLIKQVRLTRGRETKELISQQAQCAQPGNDTLARLVVQVFQEASFQSQESFCELSTGLYLPSVSMAHYRPLHSCVLQSHLLSNVHRASLTQPSAHLRRKSPQSLFARWVSHVLCTSCLQIVTGFYIPGYLDSTALPLPPAPSP